MSKCAIRHIDLRWGKVAYLSCVRSSCNPVEINALEIDVLKKWLHGEIGTLENVVLPNLKQLAALSKTANTGLQVKAYAYSKILISILV